MTLPFFFPPESRANVQIFNAPSTVTNVQWRTWTKPQATTMAMMFCIGSGASGGGGAAASNGGGGGGGSSGQAKLLIPTMFLPDQLFVQVAAPLVGGAAGSNGTDGILSYISVYDDITAQNLVLQSGAAAPTAGVAGGAGGGAGGNAGTIAVGSTFSGLGIFQAVAGVAGTAGGASANGTAQAIPTTGSVTVGGTGGGGTGATTLGGVFTAVASTLLSEWRPVSTAVTAPGASAPQTLKPWWSWGGMGGNGNSGAVAGAGGMGWYGSGGGGGGAAGASGGGAGGNSGGGYVVIISW